MKRFITLLLFFACSTIFSQLPAYVPAAGLAGFWPFDNNNASDLSPNANHGIIFGATPAPDRFGNPAHAFNFNGLSNYIRVPNHASLSNFPGLSISAWIRTNTVAGAQCIVAKWWQELNCGMPSDTYEAALSGNQVQFATNFNNFGLSAPPSFNNNVNVWKHLVFVFNNTTSMFLIYMDNVLIFSTPAAGPAICASTNDLLLGADFDGFHFPQFLHRFFNGVLDDIGIWNRPLTVCEINNLYNASLPSLSVAASPTAICAGQQAILSALGASTYTWLPAGNGATLAVSPAATAVYTVTGTQALTGCISANTIGIVVKTLPVVSVAGSNTAICQGASATLTASGAGTYTWLPGGSGSAIVVNPVATTIYTVTGTSPGGCSASQTISLLVQPLPVVTIAASSNTLCAGAQATLTASGASTYTWLPGGSNAAFISVSPPVSTGYTLSGSSGACTATAGISITVSPLPVLTAAASASAICAGQPVTLAVSGAPATGWVLNNVPVASSTVVVSPTVSATYTAFGSSAAGCAGTVSVHIHVGAAPAIQFSASNTIICAGSSLTISASPGFTLLPGLQSGTMVSVTPAASIVYTLVANPYCNNAATLAVTVNSCAMPAFGLANAAGEPAFAGSSLYKISFTVVAANLSGSALTGVTLNSDLKNTFPYPCSYTVVTAPALRSANSALAANTFFDGDTRLSLTTPAASTLMPNKKDTITYAVLLDPHGFYGLLKNQVIGLATVPGMPGLTARDSSNTGFDCDPDHDGNPANNSLATLIDIQPIDFFIPEGFSPNDDGVNDQLVVKGLNGRLARLTVFNRWGNKVCVKEGTEISWDGKVNSGGLVLGHNRLPAATYYYVFEFLTGTKRALTGFVVLQY